MAQWPMPGFTLAEGDTLFFQAVGDVYTWGKNDVALESYVDAGSTDYPYLGLNYRSVGINCGDTSASPTAGLGFSKFQACDIPWA